MPKYSIAIPAYEAGGVGHEVLEYLLETIKMQTFRDFEVVVSDHSVDNKIQILCEKYKPFYHIINITNNFGRGVISANLNNLLNLCQGKYIKWMDQDDFFLYPFSLEEIDKAVKPSTTWLATAYVHTKDRINFYNPHYPSVNNILCLMNTIGTMSCTIFKNYGDGMPRFDEALRYSHDCDWYYRFMARYGYPDYFYEPTIANFIWQNSTTSKIATPEFIREEEEYVRRKYNL
jgi:glycosyltransferase involved in cell wall biosynthesis